MSSFVVASVSNFFIAARVQGPSAGGGSGGGGTYVGDAVAAGTEVAASSDLRTILLAVVASMIVFAILYPIARALGKGKNTGVQGGAASDRALSDRMERLEQSVEAMTLEIERISEGQRYTTKLLTERLPLAVKVPQPGQSDKTLL